MKPVIIPSSYAIHKLNKGDYVKLWYFTSSGLNNAKLKSSIDEDVMVMATLAGGDTAWNLAFEYFCQACPHIITAMEDASWPNDGVTMIAKF
ncbi:hypothetical protein EDB19DRAFT_1907373 [Suillus lakei]|nr:hypothetical protein EDB19DRAFT_1907373 [Suillus lakei]